MGELEGYIENEQELEGELESELTPIPEIQIGTVETVDSDSEAAVELDESSTKLKPVMNFKIPKGKDGVTPQAGVDYFTDADKLEMKNDVEEKVQPTLENNLKAANDYTDNAIVRDFKDISFDTNTMTITFTRHDNTTFIIDLPIENMVKDGRYDPDTAELVLVLVSNQEIRIPVSGLIDDYTGVESATIQVVISADNKITCNIKAGSITKTLLTAELQEEINGKLNKSEITERTFEVTYEDGSVDEIRSVVFK